jgi:hypothetical protein
MALVRPKLVTNIWNNKIEKTVVTHGVHILFHFNIVLLTQHDVLYQEHNSVFITSVSKILAKFLLHFKKAKCHLSNSVAAFGNTHLPFASCWYCSQLTTPPSPQRRKTSRVAVSKLLIIFQWVLKK